MIDDIRYFEFRFLQAIAAKQIKLFDQRDAEKVFGALLNHIPYIEMAATMAEELYIRFGNDELQRYVSRLRGEISPDSKPTFGESYHWNNPRSAIQNFLTGAYGLQEIRITYRGLRRIQELRDFLRYDRILEPHGVLFSMQYFRRDLEDALKNNPNVTVSLISADMDDFKRINTDFGHDAGDVVMKGYLECVRDGLGLFGTGYRGVGDEVLALVLGQGHGVVIKIAEEIRKRVADLRCEYKGKPLHRVTASLGVASTPPESRTMEIEAVAKQRGYDAKKNGKNRVVAN